MLKVRPLEQSAHGYCGPACLKMVLGYFGVKKSERELVRLTGATRKHGVDAVGLLKTARALGFRGFAKDYATFADLRRYILKRRVPVIVDWFSEDDGHYSVVAHVDRRNIYLCDPEFGRRRAMPLTTFRRVWFDYVPDAPRTKNDFVIRRMIVLLSREGIRNTDS